MNVWFLLWQAGCSQLEFKGHKKLLTLCQRQIAILPQTRIFFPFRPLRSTSLRLTPAGVRKIFQRIMLEIVSQTVAEEINEMIRKVFCLNLYSTWPERGLDPVRLLRPLHRSSAHAQLGTSKRQRGVRWVQRTEEGGMGEVWRWWWWEDAKAVYEARVRGRRATQKEKKSPESAWPHALDLKGNW